MKCLGEGFFDLPRAISPIKKENMFKQRPDVWIFSPFTLN
jgi:hypothetical protein